MSAMAWMTDQIEADFINTIEPAKVWHCGGPGKCTMQTSKTCLKRRREYLSMEPERLAMLSGEGVRIPGEAEKGRASKGQVQQLCSALSLADTEPEVEQRIAVRRHAIAEIFQGDTHSDIDRIRRQAESGAKEKWG